MKITISSHVPEDEHKCILCKRNLYDKYMDIEILFNGLRVVQKLCRDCNFELGRFYRGDMD